MTGPHDTTRPISVAELLAKNGTLGAPAPARRRRRRGNSDAVTVAELTGEIPVITDDTDPDAEEHRIPEPRAHRANGAHADPRRGRRVARRARSRPARPSGPSLSRAGPRPSRRAPARQPPTRASRVRSAASIRVQCAPTAAMHPIAPRTRKDKQPERTGAEGMAPDPIEDYAGMSVDVMDSDVRDAEPVIEDSAYVRSYLQSSAGKSDAESRAGTGYADIDDVDGDEDYPDDDFDDEHTWSRSDSMRFTGMVVLQSILAVAFGAGLFIAFDQLWRWNNIVALVLSVLVILGLVVGVRVVRKTEDIGSTLIAVAVGALVTLGPLALLQSG